VGGAKRVSSREPLKCAIPVQSHPAHGPTYNKPPRLPGLDCPSFPFRDPCSGINDSAHICQTPYAVYPIARIPAKANEPLPPTEEWVLASAAPKSQVHRFRRKCRMLFRWLSAIFGRSRCPLSAASYCTHTGGWPTQALFWLEWGGSSAGRSLPAARSLILAAHSHSISTRPAQPVAHCRKLLHSHSSARSHNPRCTRLRWMWRSFSTNGASPITARDQLAPREHPLKPKEGLSGPPAKTPGEVGHPAYELVFEQHVCRYETRWGLKPVSQRMT
jgi:hypothetical protein